MLSYKMDFRFCAWKPGFVKSSHKFVIKQQHRNMYSTNHTVNCEVNIENLTTDKNSV